MWKREAEKWREVALADRRELSRKVAKLEAEILQVRSKADFSCHQSCNPFICENIRAGVALRAPRGTPRDPRAATPRPSSRARHQAPRAPPRQGRVWGEMDPTVAWSLMDGGPLPLALPQANTNRSIQREGPPNAAELRLRKEVARSVLRAALLPPPFRTCCLKICAASPPRPVNWAAGFPLRAARRLTAPAPQPPAAGGAAEPPAPSGRGRACTCASRGITHSLSQHRVPTVSATGSVIHPAGIGEAVVGRGNGHPLPRQVRERGVGRRERGGEESNSVSRRRIGV